MKIYSFYEEKVLQKTIKELACDKCGVMADHDAGNITPIKIEFGYGSRFDLETWSIDLCDDCIEEVVKPFEENIHKEG